MLRPLPQLFGLDGRPERHDGTQMTLQRRERISRKRAFISLTDTPNERRQILQQHECSCDARQLSRRRAILGEYRYEKTIYLGYGSEKNAMSVNGNEGPEHAVTCCSGGAPVGRALHARVLATQPQGDDWVICGGTVPKIV